MNTSVVNLRYKMSEVLDALDRREAVRILYHGKLKGIIYPPDIKKPDKASRHPFFGMQAEGEPVEQVMDRLRKGRYNAL